MKHITSIITITIIAGLLLTACDQQPSSPQSQMQGQSVIIKAEPPSSQEETSPSSSSSETAEFSPLDIGVLGHTEDNGPLTAKSLAEDTPIADGQLVTQESLNGMVKICQYDPENKGYILHYYTYTPGDTLGQLTRTALGLLYSQEEGIDVSSVRVEKGFVIVDLSLTPDSSAAKALGNRTAVETMLNTIAATCQENGAAGTGFLLGGGQFSLGGVTLENDGYGRYEPAEVYNQPVTPEQLDGLRGMLPYPGGKSTPAPMLDSNEAICQENEALYRLIYFGGDTGAYASPAEIPDEVKIAAGLNLSPRTYDCRQEPEKYPLYPVDDSFLEPLVSQLSFPDYDFVPKEWVGAAVQELWGPEAAIGAHVNAGSFTYEENAGVYTPPHRGGGVIVEPYFHSLEQTEKGYVAQVSYLTLGMGGVMDQNGEWLDVYSDYEQGPRIQQLEQALPRYEITAVTGEDGLLHLESSRLIGE